MRRLLVARLFVGTTAWGADVRIRGVEAIGMTVSDMDLIRDPDGHALEIVEP